MLLHCLRAHVEGKHPIYQSGYYCQIFKCDWTSSCDDPWQSYRHRHAVVAASENGPHTLEVYDIGCLLFGSHSLPNEKSVH